MQRSLIVVLASALLLGTAACGTEAPPPPTPDARERLAALAAEVWERRLESDIQARLREGLPVERLGDVSHASASEDAAFARDVLVQLDDIDRAELRHTDDLTWAVLARDAEMTVEGLEHYWVVTQVLTPYRSPIAGLRQTFSVLPVGTAEERARYVAILRDVARLVGEVDAHAREQLERGIVVPEVNMDAVVAIPRALVASAADGPFAVSAGRLPEDADGDAFHGEIAAVVDQEINPALESLAAFLGGQYRAAAPDRVGMGQYPGGDAAYRYLVRLHTTMDIAPEEIHEIGLGMIDEIQASMLAIQAELGFEGSIDDFREHVRTTPEYYPESPDEVGERLEAAANEFHAQIDRWFLTRPETPFAARRLDPALEASQTFGYYNPPTPADPVGYYNYNGSDLDERSWLNYAGLSFHELFPGHHFHLTRQIESSALPDIRRNTWHTAFTEGWGMYSTALGLESGLLDDDPLSRYGAHMMEIFVATRLVVDTGMNALGWTLQEGRDFMRTTIFESDTQIATESLRYSTDMPGQALGYQMGKREIVRLREKARAALGDRFDIRRFHEAVLAPGSLPMTVLESHVDWWIEQERAGAG